MMFLAKYNRLLCPTSCCGRKIPSFTTGEFVMILGLLEIFILNYA
jgi:hypothetical protein